MKIKIIIILLLFCFSFAAAQNNKNNANKGNASFVEIKKAPDPIKLIKPEYPEEAKNAGITGKVIVEVTIDTKGNVTDATILTVNNQNTNKSAAGNLPDKFKNIFDAPALDAAKKMKFHPGLDKNGNPVTCKVAIPFSFNLDGKKK
jgi:periplasmic protein TonB